MNSLLIQYEHQNDLPALMQPVMDLGQIRLHNQRSDLEVFMSVS
jgi:hypothetical protein